MKLQEIKNLLHLMDQFVEEEIPANLQVISEDETNFLLILQKRLKKGEKEYGIGKFTNMMASNMN